MSEQGFIPDATTEVAKKVEKSVFHFDATLARIKFQNAYAAMQAELKPAIKDSTNPHYKSKYADLAKCVETAQPVLAKHGFSVMHTTSVDLFEFHTSVQNPKAKTVLKTTLMHADGHFVDSHALLNPVKDDPQGVGAAMTYYKRFQFCAIIGLATDDDDDGNSASGVGSQQASQPAKQAEKPAQQAKPATTSTMKKSDVFDMNNLAHKKFIQGLAQEKKFVGDLKQLATDFHGKIKLGEIEAAFPADEAFDEGMEEV